MDGWMNKRLVEDLNDIFLLCLSVLLCDKAGSAGVGVGEEGPGVREQCPRAVDPFVGAGWYLRTQRCV